MTTPFRIASYNIHKAVGTDRRRDPERVAHVIAALKADITVLQEADMRLGARPTALPATLITAHSGLVPVALARNQVSLGWHGIAILTRPDVTIQQVLHLDLPGLEPRGMVIVDLDLRQGPVRVVGVHLGLLRHSRRQQLSHLLRVLSDLPQRPTLIAGDFNEYSSNVGLGRLTPGFTIHTPGRSFHARKPMFALDRFATDATLRLVDMGVMRTLTTAQASDHLPIWAEIETRDAFGAV